MYILRIDGVIREAFSQRQYDADGKGGVVERKLEEIADNDPELVAFERAQLQPKPLKTGQVIDDGGP